MAVDYVRTDTAELSPPPNVSGQPIELLWGDRVTVLRREGRRVRVRGRGRVGYVDRDVLGGDSLLEVYFIDVGQGDGVLLRTPDHRHVLIDGGWKRKSQPTGKNAADFVDWKFATDYRANRIGLNAMIVSHNDADHYGGLWDLVNPNETDELNLTDVRVEACYHAGIAWWKKPSGRGRTLGAYGRMANGNFFTQLMANRASVVRALRPNARPRLQGEWAEFMKCMTNTKRRDNSATTIQRLSHLDDYVPGFGPVPGEPSLRVLAPVEYQVDGRPGIRRLSGGDSQNTNGNGLLLRLDYRRARILLTGDLNKRSQQALLDDYLGERQEFQCDVAKACHHGSEDVSYEFLAAMRPAVTVISSGDNEGHDHPRPGVVAASATTGYLQVNNDQIVSPLIYSTELARSVSFGQPTKLVVPCDGGSRHTLEGGALRNASIEYGETKAGDRNPVTRKRRVGSTLVVAGLIYGLVNVRTNGDRILCATMNEKDHTWQIKAFQSRF